MASEPAKAAAKKMATISLIDIGALISQVPGDKARAIDSLAEDIQQAINAATTAPRKLILEYVEHKRNGYDILADAALDDLIAWAKDVKP